MDSFSILGLAAPCSLETVKQTYKRLALQHHPDKAGAQSTVRFQHIQSAYEKIVKCKLYSTTSKNDAQNGPKSSYVPKRSGSPISRPSTRKPTPAPSAESRTVFCTHQLTCDCVSCLPHQAMRQNLLVVKKKLKRFYAEKESQAKSAFQDISEVQSLRNELLPLLESLGSDFRFFYLWPSHNIGRLLYLLKQWWASHTSGLAARSQIEILSCHSMATNAGVFELLPRKNHSEIARTFLWYGHLRKYEA